MHLSWALPTSVLVHTRLLNDAEDDDDEDEKALREAALKQAKAAAAEAAAVAKASGGTQQHRVVHVERPPAIQEKRINLPILGMESVSVCEV